MPHNNLLQMSDVQGCGHYRMCFPAWSTRTALQETNFIETTRFIGDPNFYQGLTHVMLQRQVSKEQCEVFTKFFYPLSKKLGYWLTYNIDDVIGPKDIPKYNVGWKAYQGEGIYENVKSMVNLADFLIVTTEELKQYYHDSFGVELHKIIDIPNYLPRWWVGEAYDLKRQLYLWGSNNSKPRIGFTSSATHFDIHNQNEGVDDFTHIVNFIRETVDKYQWVFIGTCPPSLIDLLKAGKIELHAGSDILNFLRELRGKELSCIVAPLQDNIFNRCKSNIKLLESWSLGIPIIAQDLPLYSKYTDLVFTGANSLQNKLDWLFGNKGRYKKNIEHYRNIIDYGDSKSPNGWWMEKNLTKWAKLFTLPQKTLNIDFDGYLESINTDEDLVNFAPNDLILDT